MAGEEPTVRLVRRERRLTQVPGSWGDFLVDKGPGENDDDDENERNGDNDEEKRRLGRRRTTSDERQ